MADLRPGARSWWALVAVYVVVLFAVQPRLGFAVDAFKARWGDAALERTVWVLAGVAALAVVAALGLVWRSASPLDRLLIVGGLVLYGVGVLALEIPQERLHYVEYGVLAGLLYGAVESRPGWTPWRAAAFAFAVATGFGYLDEELQGRLWERRYFDWLDVALNARAAALGALLAVPMYRAWRRRREDAQAATR